MASQFQQTTVLNQLAIILAWASLGASLLAFAAYGLDKAAAKRGTRRLPERHLLLLGMLGGWPGALIAQRLFHHKTRKESFQLAFSLSVVVHLGLCAGLWLVMR